MPLIVAVIVASIGCAVAGQLSLKSAMNRIGRVSRQGTLRWPAGAWPLFRGLALYGVSTVLWLFVLSRVELSFAFPFISLSYVAILLGARFGLREHLNPSRLVGSALIILGVLLVSLS